MTLHCLSCGNPVSYYDRTPTHDDWYCPDCMTAHLVWRAKQDPSRFTEEFMAKREHEKMIERESERYD